MTIKPFKKNIQKIPVENEKTNSEAAAESTGSTITTNDHGSKQDSNPVPAEETTQGNCVKQKVFVEVNQKDKSPSKNKENMRGAANNIDENASTKTAIAHEKSDTSIRITRSIDSNVEKTPLPEKNSDTNIRITRSTDSNVEKTPLPKKNSDTNVRITRSTASNVEKIPLPEKNSDTNIRITRSTDSNVEKTPLPEKNSDTNVRITRSTASNVEKIPLPEKNSDTNIRITRSTASNVEKTPLFEKKSDTNIRITRSTASNVGKTPLSEKNPTTSACDAASTEEISVKKMKKSCNNPSPQKCVVTSSPAKKVDSSHEDAPQESHSEKTIITIIKVQQNPATETDSANKNTSPIKNLDNNDVCAVLRSPMRTPCKSQKTSNERTPNKCNDDNSAIDKSTLTDTKLGIVKIETHKIEHTSCDESTENSHNDGSALSVSANINIETLLLTPRRVSEVLDQLKIEICKTELSGSPQVSTPKVLPVSSTPSMTSHNCKKEQSTILQTPQSSETLKSMYENDILKETPMGGKKRKGRTNSDSEYLSDTLKSELCDPDRINEFEAIDMLHDLDTVINFEDSKMNSCSLLASFSHDCFAQDTNKQTDVDPLFIDPSEQRIQSPVETTVQRPKWEQTVDRSAAPSQKPLRRSQRIHDYGGVKKYFIARRKPVRQKQNRKYQDSDIEKLQNLRVQLIHNVLPQHKIGSWLCYMAHADELAAEFQKYGPLKRGLYTPEEDEIIMKNWIIFCKIHEWNPAKVKPFLRFKQHGTYTLKQSKERQKFVQFLSNGLPWRTLYSVYSRFKNIYKGYKRKSNGHYTKDEDEAILSYIQNNKTPDNKDHMNYSELSNVLGRSNSSLRMRYQLLNKDQQTAIRKVPWTLELMEQFIETLMDVTMSKSLNELKYAIIPKVIWKIVERKLGIDEHLLKKLWFTRLHLQLFCKKPIYLNDIRIQIIEYLYNKGISSKRELNFSKIVRYFDGMTIVFLRNTLWSLTTRYHKSKPFIEIIESLYHETLPKIQQKSTDKYLPRLRYRNGKLKIIKKMKFKTEADSDK